jgi:hypothetical protein
MHLDRSHLWRLLGAAILAGAVLNGPAHAAAPARTSSCVACHTDAEKLKAESAKVPVSSGSALQAGKG